jgi:hypothetical protein
MQPKYNLDNLTHYILAAATAIRRQHKQLICVKGSIDIAVRMCAYNRITLISSCQDERTG